MYVINHLGPKSVVEVLQIKYNKECLDNSDECTVSLRHVTTVDSPLFDRYALNDLVEGMNQSEIYITRDN